jgi:excisionase family DNA binding protein
VVSNGRVGMPINAPVGNVGSPSELSQTPFLTMGETAALITVSKRSLQKMMREGLPFYEPVPGRRVFRRDEVLRWLEANKRRVRSNEGAVPSSGGLL